MYLLAYVIAMTEVRIHWDFACIERTIVFNSMIP